MARMKDLEYYLDIIRGLTPEQYDRLTKGFDGMAQASVKARIGSWLSGQTQPTYGKLFEVMEKVRKL